MSNQIQASEYTCKCGAVREPNDILNTSGVVEFDDFTFTASFTCRRCLDGTT